jgi:sucrose-6-phosphatase
MTDRLLICTDLDRTLIPNGTQSESRAARAHFRVLAGHSQITLAYVSGRHRQLIERAICHYRLPQPDYVIGDVGTTLYRVGAVQSWQPQDGWEDAIRRDWGGHNHADLKRELAGLSSLRLQERAKQNAFKLSYYVPRHCDHHKLSTQIHQRLQALGVHCNLIWSDDEPQGVVLLDILPAGASKFQAIAALQHQLGFDDSETVFCGDGANDLEVLSSRIPAVLVANAEPQVKQQALSRSAQAGNTARLYLAKGGFHGMNGNYSAGMLEGIAHLYPGSAAWMGFDEERQQA